MEQEGLDELVYYSRMAKSFLSTYRLSSTDSADNGQLFSTYCCRRNNASTFKYTNYLATSKCNKSILGP